VEAGGVEPIHAVENTQVTDFGTPPIPMTPQFPSTFAQFCSLAPLEGSRLSNHALQARCRANAGSNRHAMELTLLDFLGKYH
jgi:hypothetical protein